MAKSISQDITVLFTAFDVKNRSYNELNEEERYTKIKKSWSSLVLLSKCKKEENNDIKNSNNYLVQNLNDVITHKVSD
jgi:uncharacterized membrane protein YgaE (UPF0421/DUF939 family)